MYPRTLLDADVRTESERRVFEALEAGLGDDWEAFHSAGWMLRDPVEGADDGEIDFVLVHPREGVVCLEVKGGGIECRHGEWYRRDGSESPVRIRDPFAQALDHRYALERKIGALPDWKGRKLFIVHALTFPYATIHQLALAPDAEREILIDRHDIADLPAALGRVIGYHRGARDRRPPPDEEGMQMLRDLLAPRVQIRVPMAAHFTDEEERLILLTHEQGMALARMRRDLRMVITGCAGSGKTMLAVEHAKRLARAGQRVLFVCFNRALREHLAQSERGVDNLDIYTFHGVCRHLAGRAGIKLPSYPRDETPQSFWEEELPDALVEAVAAIGEQYDALIVDEAQDLHTHWLSALMCTLRDEKNAPVWLFMDDNQRVYDATLEVPPEFRPYDLTVNCRNTQAIHSEVMKLYEGDVEPEVKGPPGRSIELLQTNDAPATVAGVLERLCGEEEVPPQDVVVLSSHGFDNSAVAHGVDGRFRLVKERGALGARVQLSSIRGFKGLESPVVVLCELEDTDEPTRDQQLYVGLSRARNHCVVVAPQT